jgi:ribosome maturation factor RimP
MERREMEERVKEIIDPVIRDMGIALDYLELSQMRKRFLLRVFVQKEGGVTLDDCAKVSREIEAVLDVEDPIPYSYTLEVSSPGLDRPLRNPGDFKRFTGKMARVTTSRPVENQSFFIGEIIEAGDDGVVLLLPKDKRVAIPHKDISRARLEVTA